MKKAVLLVALCIMTMMTGYAQDTSKVKGRVDEIVKRYENTNGVDCMTAVKGEGLGLLKMMLNQQFGRDFMKGVTSITIINYSDAEPETCIALRKELDQFCSLLEEFRADDDEEFADNDYVRIFALPLEEGAISDFVIAIEDKESKMMMHMAGKIKFDNVD
jgi:hypothetical protein